MVLFKYSNLDVAEPYIVAMILEADVTLAILATAVVEKCECIGPSLL